MDLGILALRLVHIAAAIAWAGGSVFVDVFVQPASDHLGPAAKPFLAALNGRRGLAVYFPITATLTVLAGSFLYWIDSGGNVVGYLTGGGSGTVFGIGGIAGWIAWFVGGIGLLPNAARISRATAEIARSGPTPALEAEVAAAKARARRAARAALLLLAVAIVCMAVARYTR